MKKLKVRNVLTLEQVLKLKKKLRDSGLTQAILAEKFRITSSLLSNYIAGRASMPLWMFEELHNMFKLDEINKEDKK